MMKYYHYHYCQWTIIFTITRFSSSFTPFLVPSSTTIISRIKNYNNIDINKSSLSIHHSNSHHLTRLHAKLLNANDDVNDKDSDEQKQAINKNRKAAALKGIVAQIEKSYGRGSLVKLGSAENMNIESIKSGSRTLDIIMGGGYPKGRIIEIYGPESSGKTTLALHAIASVQGSVDGSGTAAFIDAEHALDPAYAKNLGVNVDELFISQPDSGEMALDIVDKLVRSNAMDIIVIDSVAALVPRAELEGNMDDQQIGLQARLMSKAMRKIVGSLAASKCTVIFINQLRSKVGVFYGSSEVTSGGNALKFYASIRLDTRRKEMLPDNKGIKIKVKTVKNKVFAPFQIVELDVLFGSGIDSLGSLFDAALTVGCIQRKGSWYSYHNNNFAQGRSNGIECLKNDEDFCKKIEKETEELTMINSNQQKNSNNLKDDNYDEELLVSIMDDDNSKSIIVPEEETILE